MYVPVSFSCPFHIAQRYTECQELVCQKLGIHIPVQLEGVKERVYYNGKLPLARKYSLKWKYSCLPIVYLTNHLTASRGYNRSYFPMTDSGQNSISNTILWREKEIHRNAESSWDSNPGPSDLQPDAHTTRSPYPFAEEQKIGCLQQNSLEVPVFEVLFGRSRQTRERERNSWIRLGLLVAQW